MNEVEVTVKISMDRIYEILSDLSDAQTVALIKKLIPDLGDSYIDELENFIGNL
jgi:hypothetical protein